MLRPIPLVVRLITAASLASLASAPVQAQGSREAELDRYYPCAIEFDLAQKERLNDYSNATKNDPCVVAKSQAELKEMAGAGEASDLSGMLDSLGQGGAAVAQFQCEFVGHVVMGLPAAMNRRQPQVTLVALTILESGAVMINGTTIQPSRTKPAEMNSSATLESALYDVRSVLRAVAGSGSSPPVFGLTPDENRQLNMGLGLALTLTEQMMGDRERYMVVMLPTNTVGFFDAGPGGQVVNGGTTPCIRTM